MCGYGEAAYLPVHTRELAIVGKFPMFVVWLHLYKRQFTKITSIHQNIHSVLF